MTRADYVEASEKALSLFEYGQVISLFDLGVSKLHFLMVDFTICLTLQQVALEHGLILVDTKYEFGKANDGSILLIDEVKCNL